ncbi:MAG TPA: NAD-dependent epimerase/dehydratase family protein [Candidatus Baltobacteraceae bacterium]|nr:NAD-dependent epimerase/dehydratase family protein [Candidatus Baltobacteraceae bacterium]
MSEKFYTKTNQIIIDAVMVGVSFLLAYQIRYDGAVPPYQARQCWILLLPFVAARLLSYFAFGVERIPWRHFGVGDVFRLGQTQLAVSAVWLALRYASFLHWPIVEIPTNVIAIEFLLSLSGSLGVRMLRRQMYERQEGDQGGGKKRPRRVLLIGAGVTGARVAKEMALNPSVRVVGFLDDDPRNVSCVIAGASVLGTTGMLADLAKKRVMDEVLICTPPSSRASFKRFAVLLENLPITTKFMPTIDEIIEGHDALHLSVNSAPGNGNGNGSNGNGNGNGSGRHPLPSQGSSAAPMRSEIRDKRIVITGGAGFIGSNLAERLAGDNEIVLIDRTFRDQPLHFTSLASHRNVKLVQADILEGKAVDAIVRDAQVVIHAAAIVGVGRVCSQPRETLETNFSGTSRILKALENSSRIERFVYFSTSEVFGVNSFRVHEDAPSLVGPAAEARWSYAIAKLAGEHLVQAYYRQCGMPVVTVRPFNVFGPRRLGAHAMKSFILSALTGNPIEVHGDGSQIRSWCYIHDFCDALIEMIARPAAMGQDFNIGNPANTVTILQLAQQIAEMTHTGVPIKFLDHPFPDIEIRVPSLTKAQTVLDYKPAYDLASALAPTIAWYQEHLAYFEPRLAAVAKA